MKLRYYSHASFQFVGYRGTRLLSDPWIYNPIYGNTIWQFPECPIPRSEYYDQDVLYISHDHPDHFCCDTLSQFPRTIPIIIRNYGENNPIKPILSGLGFSKIIELNHRDKVQINELEVTLFIQNATTDSAIVISDGEHTIFNQNDCMLPLKEVQWIGETFNLDTALLFFSSASIYPTFFEMPNSEKASETLRRNQKVMERSLEYARCLGISIIIPCAGDCVYFRYPETDQYAGCLPVEFQEYIKEHDYEFKILAPKPGDVLDVAQIRSLDFSPAFLSRIEWIESLQKLRQRKDIQNMLLEINNWEDSFGTDCHEFIQLFFNYCTYVQKNFEEVFMPPNPPELITVRITGFKDADSFSLEITLDFSREICHLKQLDALSSSSNHNVHMTLEVHQKYLSMVASKALTFDDLKAGYIKIYRPEGYSPEEAAFWHFLSVFSGSFLEGHKPSVKTLKKFDRKVVSQLVVSSASNIN